MNIMSNHVHSYKSKSGLTISEVSKLLGVSTKTLRRWEASGKLMAERGANGYRIYREDLINKFKNNTSRNIFPKWLLATSLWSFVGFYGNYVFQNLQITNHQPQIANIKPSVLAATTDASEISNKYTFTVNVPSKFNETVTFLKDIVAPNV
ncbi:MAG: helix-turn-helix domain-containing protein, partial [Microgenomates group bacterium]